MIRVASGTTLELPWGAQMVSVCVQFWRPGFVLVGEDPLEKRANLHSDAHPLENLGWRI